MNSTAVLQRSSMRGLRKCTTCGGYNGQRAKSCRNKDCAQSKKIEKPRPTVKLPPETVQLHTLTGETRETRLFSVPSREKDPNQRSFVQITDRTISSDDDGCIISRNAICYVDTCKYDSHDVNISCKHIQWALEGSTRLAEVVPIHWEVWNRLRRPSDDVLRERLWETYHKAATGTPMVQMVSERMFAVECEVNTVFPAGRLHVTLMTNGKSFGSKDIPKKSIGIVCSCKKSLLPNRNDLDRDKDVCGHIWLVIAAILSSPKMTADLHEYIMNYVEHQYVEPAPLEINGTEIYFDNTSLENCLLDTDCINFTKDDFYDCDISLSEPDSNLIDSTHPIDEHVELIHIPPFLDPPPTAPINPIPDHHQAFDLENIKIVNESMNDDLQSLELIDCQIELMDEFRLTDHIDLCSNEIEMDENDLFGNAIVNLPLLANDIEPDVTVHPLDPVRIEETVNQIKETPVEVTDGIMVPNAIVSAAVPKIFRNPRHDPDVELSSTLLFDQWLDSVNEQINQRMDFNDSGRPEPLVSSVSHGFFNTFRTRFSTGQKRRLPLISNVNVGKRMGLCRFTWKFTNIELIRNIFRTKSSTIENERLFRKCKNGRYKALLPAPKHKPASQLPQTGRPIQPTKYSTALKLKPASSASAHSNEASAFTIEWTPNVLPKSRFGEMRIHFQFCHKKNNRVIDCVRDSTAQTQSRSIETELS